MTISVKGKEHGIWNMASAQSMTVHLEKIYVGGLEYFPGGNDIND